MIRQGLKYKNDIHPFPSKIRYKRDGAISCAASSPPEKSIQTGEGFDCDEVLVPMIIKGLFRRYERWNPVHPTLGTFWGMGIGIGCGVGWGPGFGPEVIGYVGAGCGVGFCVGVTFVGLGIGLPSNYLVRVRSNAFSARRSDASESRALDTSVALKTMAEDGWNHLIVPSVSFLQNETHRRFSGLKASIPSKPISKHIASTFECIEAFKQRRWPREGGT